MRKPGELVHPGRRGGTGGDDLIVPDNRAAVVDDRTLGIERDPLLLHPQVCLVPCGIDDAGEFDMVPGMEGEDLLAERGVELDWSCAHRFTSTVA